MVMVKDLTELTLRDLWREVKEEEDWWEEISKRTLNMVMYVVSKSETIWPCELLDTLEATALLPNGFIIVPSYL